MDIFYIYNTDKEDYKNVVENLPEDVNIVYTATAFNLRFGEAISILKSNYHAYENYSDEEIIEQLSFLIDYYNVLKSSFSMFEDVYEKSYDKIAICYGEFINNFDNIPDDADIVIINENQNYHNITKLQSKIGPTNCIVYTRMGMLAMIDLINQIQLPLAEYFCNNSQINISGKIASEEVVLYA